MISLTAYCGSQEEFETLRSVVFGRIQELHKKFDIYNEYEGLNNLCTVNRLAGQAVPVDGDILELLASALQAEKLTGDNIYKVLIYFEKLYAVMSQQEKRQLMETLISEIQIYEERQPNGQWLKSIKFKLPIIEEDMSLSLDNDTHIESVVLLTRVDPGT